MPSKTFAPAGASAVRGMVRLAVERLGDDGAVIGEGTDDGMPLQER